MAVTTARPWVARKQRVVVSAKPRKGRLRRRRYAVTGVGIVVALLVNVPLLNALWTSIKTNGAISSAPTLLFTPTLSHYRTMWTSSLYNFPHYFLNSILLSAGSAALVLFISVLGSYSIVRLGFSGRKLLFVVGGIMLIPPITFALPLYLLIQKAGFVDTVPALIVADGFVNLPLGLLLMCGFQRDMPVEIEEAGLVDGCSVYGALWRLVLPLMGPALASVAILTFMFSWDDYLFALILTASNATPVTAGAADFITSYGVQWGNISAATFMSVIPPIAVGFLAQKYLVRGLTVGAVKG